MNKKITRFFSKPLMKQNIKSNRILIIVVILIMCMMSTVINGAMSVMGEQNKDTNIEETQKDFYSYLYVFASYNEMAGTHLSYDDFIHSEDTKQYQVVFDMMKQKSDMDLSVNQFKQVSEDMKKSDVPIETYIHQFEYTYALGQVKGCFSGEDLNIQDMMTTMFEVMGVSSELVENMSNMDMTTMLNQMYFTVMGLLPIFILIVIMGNALIVDQVDKGSMAYVLSTPTKRSAVALTQAIFMIFVPLLVVAIVCATRIASSFVFFDEVNVAKIIVSYVGMYILVEAIGAICYFGSCFFNRSRNSMAFGGGLTVWFFIASLLGMFGSPSLVDMGMGVESLNIFNKLTLIGLYDLNSIATIGSGALDTAFIWKFAILAGVAIVFYVAGFMKFKTKDLPL
ncbi:ABC transporter permease [Candidatus Stoquefichus sp. SB1]|jgi:ABC-type transport system involved in multi-copper enzyme maturation permease subunit|uniref:ABC transporter permease n=1 Tax=Candidatus Stoquefichus sp. SB1 TaxID=1658109 RepID=UPI00067F5352|nr:ABC transporter permease subunit [Candidatus Stoquefichus sp. SB1]